MNPRSWPSLQRAYFAELLQEKLPALAPLPHAGWRDRLSIKLVKFHFGRDATFEKEFFLSLLLAIAGFGYLQILNMFLGPPLHQLWRVNLGLLCLLMLLTLLGSLTRSSTQASLRLKYCLALAWALIWLGLITVPLIDRAF